MLYYVTTYNNFQILLAIIMNYGLKSIQELLIWDVGEAHARVS
jgi:hypothetical protein